MNRFVILMYHMVRDPGNDLEARYACPPPRFEQHMRQLRKHGYQPVSLDTIWEHMLQGADLPEKAFAVTLDDGFEDNYLAAYPILCKYSVPATIFLATGVIGKNNGWMSELYPVRRMLTREQILEMTKNELITFGAHTVNHPKLSQLNDSEAANEIVQCKQEIEELTGSSCRYFAYPYGLFNQSTPELVKSAGYSLACSTRSGFNNSERNPYLLHRIEVYGSDPWWKLKQKMTFGINNASVTFPWQYYYGRIKDRFITHQ